MMSSGREVVVVEYLEEATSRELLCKYPDNSAFDFDYSQSSIWSPLVPRPFLSFLADGNRNCGCSDFQLMVVGLGIPSPSSTRRKLSYGEDGGLLDSNNTNIKKVTANIKRKITTAVLNNLHNIQNYHKMMKTEKEAAFDFSPNPRKARWGKMLKAASKPFKKKSKNKHLAAHLNISI